MPRKTLLVLIILALFSLPVIAMAQSDTPIAVGDTVNGELTADATSADYSLQGHSGDVVSIRLTSDAFDSYLTLTSPDGQVLVTDDDSAGGSNAGILDYNLPDDGTYTIRVDSYNQISTGEYTLEVTGTVSENPTEATATPTAPPPDATNPPSAGGSINIGDTVNGSVDGAEGALEFTFEGNSGDVVTIDLSSPDFDAYLTLQGPNGTRLASDDDSAGNLNSRIEGIPLPADGTYTITVSSYGGGAEGDFTLSITAGEGGEPTAEPTTGPTDEPTAAPTQNVVEPGGEIDLNSSIDGELSADASSASYTFTTDDATSVTITLTSDAFDPLVELYDADGNLLTSDDDSAGNLNSLIEDFALEDAGTYTVQVKSAGGPATGAFTLSVSTGGTVTPTETPTEEPTAEPTTEPVEPGSEISLGDTISGTLTEDNTVDYTFEGEEGQAVTITLTSDAFDTYLTLQGPDGEDLTTDDDSAGNLNSRIENFILPETGTYTINVSSFDTSASGDFTLALSGNGGGGGEPTPVPGGSDLSIGDTVSGELSAGQPTAEYTFEGEAGQLVSITVTSDDFDTYLTLEDSTGYSLVTDDDSAGNLDSRIGTFSLPSNGTYTIIVESYDGLYGGFELSLVAATVETLDFGQIVDGELSADSPTQVYVFSGTEGDVISISLSSSAFDTYLTLTASGDGYPLVENDDGSGSTDSLIGPYTLPQDGDYLVTVSSYDGTGVGSFSLTLERATLIPIAYDDTVEAEFGDDASSVYYSFEGAIGDIIDIEVDSPVDTSLAITGPDGYRFFTDADGGAGYNPEALHLILNQEGTYIILLQSAVPGDSGTASLTLTKSAARSLNDGPQEVRLTDTVYQDVLTYEGTAGETVRLTVELASSSGSSSPSITVSQDGVTVATLNAGYVGAASIEFTVPADGQLTIQVSDYSYTSLVLRVSIETTDN